uniref:major outer membrane protein n=1 Tax=Sulfurovum sp. TaxID=1969726 RepID=UPI0025E8FFB5
MKFTKLSLVAALAVSAAFAGGDIAPVEPVVEAPAVKAEACNSNTTLNSKAVAYYYTTDAAPNDMFSKENSQLGTAVTFDVSHKLFDGITANFSAVGFANITDDVAGYMENSQTGAFINVANITATYGDTTFILGRQLLSSPMVGGFDWLLAPGAFEAYTVANSSIENLTLVGTYLRTWRPNNSGNTW